MKQVIFLFITSVILHAGWVIEEEVKYSDGESFAQTLYFDQGKFKSISGNETIIIDINNDQIFFAYDDQKLYFGGKIASTIKELRELTNTEMNNLDFVDMPLPEDMQIVTVAKIKDGIKIDKFNTTKYQVLVDGELKEEIFVSKDIAIHKEIDQKALIETLIRLSGDDLSRTRAMYDLDEKYLEILSSGYPVRSLEYDANGDVVLTEVKTAKKADLKKDEFLPPIDYKKVAPKDIYHLD